MYIKAVKAKEIKRKPRSKNYVVVMVHTDNKQEANEIVNNIKEAISNTNRLKNTKIIPEIYEIAATRTIL